jgi:glycosyltransferase A (GT-A) superfamily protein (DUF2064 family)
MDKTIPRRNQMTKPAALYKKAALYKQAALGIFVKTPGFSPIKTRLAADIGEAAAAMVYQKLLFATAAVARAASQSGIAPYWAVGDSGIAESHWREFSRLPTGGGGLGTRLWRVYKELRKRHRAVILIGADSPQLSPDAIVRAAALVDKKRIVAGPANDGGFYLFAGAMPIPRALWESVAYSGEDTLKQLLARLRQQKKHAGAKPPEIILLETQTDIDDRESLTLAAAALQTAPLREQRKIARFFIAAAGDGKDKNR